VYRTDALCIEASSGVGWKPARSGRGQNHCGILKIGRFRACRRSVSGEKESVFVIEQGVGCRLNLGDGRGSFTERTLDE